MAIVSETVVVTVTGANPTTKTYSVLVNTVTGDAVSNPLSVSLVGTNSGTDMVVATMPSHVGVAPSNTADIAWQPTNGLLAVGPITITPYANSAMTRGWPTFGSALAGATISNSFVFNQVAPNYPIVGFTDTVPGLSSVAGYSPTPSGGGYKLNPMVAVQQTAGGGYASYTTIAGTTTNGSGGNHPGFVLDCLANLVVKTAGWYTIYVNYANVSSFGVYIGNSTVAGGGTVTFASQNFNGGNGANPFPGTSPRAGYGNLAVVSTNNSAVAHPNVVSSYVNFSKPGIYPIEAIYNQYLSCQQGGDNNSFFQITYLQGQQNQNVGQGGSSIGSQSFPVTITATPPNQSPPTGALQLTPNGGAAALQIQGLTDTLSLNILGVPYTTVPYIPLLEGTAGDLRLYDNGTVFNFGGVTYGGVAPDYASAISTGAVAIAGDNTAWQGLLSVTPTGTSPTGYLKLAYNGAQFPFTGIDVTNLTITADDIAWFNNANKSYDLFAPSSSGGGLTYPIQIAYMVMPPSLASLTASPLTMPADGGAHPITVTLPQPMSPEQQGLFGTGNTVSASASASGGVTVTVPSAVLNEAGWLTGWQMSCTVPHSSTNGSFQLSMNATGTLTYLNGEAFVVGGGVTYFNGIVATVATTGLSFSPPTNYSFTVTGGVSGTTITGSITLTAVVFSTDNGTMNPSNFFYINSGTKTIIGGTPTVSSPTPVSGGYHTTITQTVVSLFAWGSTFNLGYQATDALSTLGVSYTSSVTYTNGNPNPGGGGGGGGGCPAVEMWLSESMQVSNCVVGDTVEALCGDITSDEYLTALPITDDAEVRSLSYSIEPCHYFKTENGAEVIVSASTPFPTRESIEFLAKGRVASEIAIYANEIQAGMTAITNVGNGPEWSLITETEYVGERQVARIYCGGKNFAAGVKWGKYIYTHNIQNPK